MSNNRLATLRHAEALAGRGRLDEAIAEYRRLLDGYPRDWNTTNLLGDLLVKSGEVAPAVALFTRAAEILAVEGFAARACALYKKILKLQPGSDEALMQAGELSARQGLVADARTFFDAAAAGRRQRGEARGALEVRVRLGALDPEDVPGRIDAAGARLELGDRSGALRGLTDFGLSLLEQGRGVDARAVLAEVVTLDPANTTVAYLVELLSAGRVEDALAIINGTATLDTLEVVIEEEEQAPSLELSEAPHAEPVIDDAPARDAAPSTANIEDLFDRLRREAAGVGDDGAAQMALVRGLASSTRATSTAASSSSGPPRGRGAIALPPPFASRERSRSIASLPTPSSG